MTPTPTQPNAVPRAALIGAAILVAAALSLAGGARLVGYKPAQPAPSAVVASVALRFEDRADGAILIYLAGRGAPSTVLAPATNGFVRGVLRGLARERRAENIGPDAPFTLTRWADGRLSLDDPATGRHVDLEVFGPTNAGAFASIFEDVTRAPGAS